MLKVGDIVTIREDLVHNNEYDGVRFDNGMNEYRGKEMEIKGVLGDIGKPRYSMVEGGYFTFSKEMFKELQIRKELNEKEKIYADIVKELFDVYRAKNADYGDSVGDTYKKIGDTSFLTRIIDKVNRATTLVTKGTQEVQDEKLEDTIQDLINYGILWLIEKNISQQTED